MGRFRHAALPVFTLLAIILYPQLSLAAVFNYLPARVSASYTPPPLLIIHPGITDEEILSLSLGPNFTSATIQAKATTHPDTVCNPYMDDDLEIWLVTPEGRIVSSSLCWPPVGYSRSSSSGNAYNMTVIPAFSTVSYDGYGTGSLLYYNDTIQSYYVPGFYYIVVEAYGFWLQSFRYPSLGVNDTGQAYIVFAYNGTVDYDADLSTSVYVYPYVVVAILDSTFNVVGSGTFPASFDGGWHVVNVSYSPSSLGMSPGTYYLAVGFMVYILAFSYNLLAGGTVVIYSLRFHLDDVGHFLPMEQGYYGVYLTAPAIWPNETLDWTGWNASVKAVDLAPIGSYLEAWYLYGLGFPVSDALEVQPYASLPLEGAETNVSSLEPLGLLSTFIASPSPEGSASLRVAYYNGGVRVEYPVEISFTDPPHDYLWQLLRHAEASYELKPAHDAALPLFKCSFAKPAATAGGKEADIAGIAGFTTACGKALNVEGLLQEVSKSLRKLMSSGRLVVLKHG